MIRRAALILLAVGALGACQATTEAVHTAAPTATIVPTTVETTEHEATMVALQLAWQDQPAPVQAKACRDWHGRDPLAAVAIVEDPAAGPDFYDNQAVIDWFKVTCP